MSSREGFKSHDNNAPPNGLTVDLDERIIHLYGDIDTEISVQFMSNMITLAKRGHEPVIMLINSAGGNLSDGFSIMDTIEAAPFPVHGIAHGICCSAATLILTSCKKRSSMSRTFFLIHELSQMAGDVSRYREAEEEAKIMKRMMTTMIDTYAKTTKIARDDIQNDLEKTKWMTAQEALAYGLVEDIMTVLPGTTATTSLKKTRTRQPKPKKEESSE